MTTWSKKNFLNNRKILFICNKLGNHEKKFLKICEELGNTITLTLTDTVIRNNHNEIDLAVIVDLNNLYYFTDKKVARKQVGISMAYDINEQKNQRQIADKISNLDHIVVDCDHVENQIVENYNYYGGFTKISYGCDYSYFRSKVEIHKSYNNLGILSPRTWNPIHQNEIVVETARKINEKGSFVTIMKPPSDSKIEYEQISNLRLIPNSEYKNNELVELFNNHAFYLSTSKSDGSSITLLEAMSAGRVCLVSDYPSNLEWISDNESGLIYNQNSPQHLLKVIKKAFTLSHEERSKIGLAAQEVVKIKGDWDKNKKILKKTFLDLMD